MSDDRDTLTPEPYAPPSPPAPEDEPAFLARARRILAGDVRPEDYLPVTSEVRHRVELFMDWARGRANGVPLAPEVEPRQLRSELLSFHHGGVNIAYIDDDVGVIVLGVGLEESGRIVRTLAPTTDRTIAFGPPDPWTF